MRLKEIVLAASLASCAGVPKTTRTPGVDGIIGNLPETVCPKDYTPHVEQIVGSTIRTIRACLKNDIPDIKAHCEKVYSGGGRYGGTPNPIERDEVLVWDCRGIVVQSVGSGVYGALVGSGVYSATVPSKTKVEEGKETLDLPQAQPTQTDSVQPR